MLGMLKNVKKCYKMLRNVENCKNMLKNSKNVKNGKDYLKC